MNKERRKRIAHCIEELSNLREEVAEICSEEQDYMDNMPENMQDGRKYEESEEYTEALDDACDSIDEAIDSLGKI